MQRHERATRPPTKGDDPADLSIIAPARHRALMLIKVPFLAVLRLRRLHRKVPSEHRPQRATGMCVITFRILLDHPPLLLTLIAQALPMGPAGSAEYLVIGFVVVVLVVGYLLLAPRE